MILSFPPALIKIDVEGFEWPVISGAKRQLLHHRPILYVEAKRIPGTVAYLNWLMSQGWRCYWHFALFYLRNNFRGNSENIFGTTGDMNVLAVPADLHDDGQPTDLPEIRSPDEDWRKFYSAYYQKNNVPIP